VCAAPAWPGEWLYMHSPVPRGNAAITTDATVFRDRAATFGVGAFSESDERLSVGGLSALG
jgi:hypothetical protein